MHFRLSAIEPDINKMHGAVNTLCGLTEKVMGVQLGAYFHTMDELKKEHPANLSTKGEDTLEIGERMSPYIKSGTGFTIR